MADVTQLQTDLADLQSAVQTDEAAITAVQGYVGAQGATIADLTAQIAALKAAGPGDLDLSGLEASLASLKAQNVALAGIVPPAPVPTAA